MTFKPVFLEDTESKIENRTGEVCLQCGVRPATVIIVGLKSQEEPIGVGRILSYADGHGTLQLLVLLPFFLRLPSDHPLNRNTAEP